MFNRKYPPHISELNARRTSISSIKILVSEIGSYEILEKIHRGDVICLREMYKKEIPYATDANFKTFLEHTKKPTEEELSQMRICINTKYSNLLDTSLYEAQLLTTEKLKERLRTKVNELEKQLKEM